MVVGDSDTDSGVVTVDSDVDSGVAAISNDTDSSAASLDGDANSEAAQLLDVIPVKSLHPEEALAVTRAPRSNSRAMEEIVITAQQREESQQGRSEEHTSQLQSLLRIHYDDAYMNIQSVSLIESHT